MPVIGTAGHVDHGKSTLVKALTGRDPDRWDEEKQRGLTIDLGFAWAALPGGIEAGFVDVPGHERFIKNMLAGVDGIDVALFVVAADEGWMPQSEEHLAVLDLLGVARGVVALTRADLVDDDLLELATLEVHDRLEGTSLAGSPVIPTAAPDGGGIPQLAEALGVALAEAPEAGGDRPRLWVDRSFVIAGAGTVVTGTLTGGPLAVGDQVAVWPGARPARVRSLESHERPRDVVAPGNRTAANLAGLERQEVERGAMVGFPGHWEETRRAVVEVRTVRGLPEPLTSRGAYHLHFGSGTWPARLRLLEGDTLEDVGAAMISVLEPLPMAIGDRFILRDVGRRAVVAGGRVLDPAPPRRAGAARRAVATLSAALAGGPDRRAQALLDAHGAASLAALAAMSGGGRPAHGLFVDDAALAPATVAGLAALAVAEVTAFHDANPLRPGMPKASLASRLGISVAQVDAIVAGHADLVGAGGAVRAASFSGGWGPAEERAWEAAREALTEAGAAAPRASQLGLGDELMHALLREGRLEKVGDDLVYLPEQLDQIAERLHELPDGFTVADFRDLLGVSRRQAVPLLEWLDRTGATVRTGDIRRVRPQQPRGPAPGGGPPR